MVLRIKPIYHQDLLLQRETAEEQCHAVRELLQGAGEATRVR